MSSGHQLLLRLRGIAVASSLGVPHPHTSGRNAFCSLVRKRKAVDQRVSGHSQRLSTCSQQGLDEGLKGIQAPAAGVMYTIAID